MHPDSGEGAGGDTFAALRALFFIQYYMAIPGESLFGAGSDTEMLPAGNAYVDGAHFRPSILDVYPGQLDTLRPLVVRSRTGEHAESTVCAGTSFQFKHA